MAPRSHTTALLLGSAALCLLGGLCSAAPGAAAPKMASPAQVPGEGDGYGYGPPPAPACAAADVRLAIGLPKATYHGGHPVPFRVRIANTSGRACSVTALQPPSGFSTELVYVRIYNKAGKLVLIPSGFPGLRARQLPRSVPAHGAFSYNCTWDGYEWSRPAPGQPVRRTGVPAPAGQYSAVAVLARPAIATPALHFALAAPVAAT